MNFSDALRPNQIYVVSQIIYLLSRLEKIKVHHETICITKITMIAKCLEDTTSVHSQLDNYIS